MTKARLFRWWFTGVAVMLAAGALLYSSLLALLAHSNQVSSFAWAIGNDSYSIAMLTVFGVGCGIAVVGIGIQLGAWIAALSNARRLSDQAWARALLWWGIAGLVTIPVIGIGGLIHEGLMTAYFVGAPDATAPEPHATTPNKATINRRGVLGFVGVGAGLLFALLVARLTYPGMPLYGAVWPALAIEGIGFVAAGAGLLAITAAWFGALFNARELTDKTWSKRVLWIGIVAALLMPALGLGAVILAVLLIAYGHAAPDARVTVRHKAPTSRPMAASSA